MVNLIWKKEKHFSSKKPVETLLKRSEIICPGIVNRFKDQSHLKDNWFTNVIKQIKENGVNKLIWGDNLEVLHYLLKNSKAKIDLIYIDPPFFTNSEFYHKVFIGTSNKSFKKVAYNDKWNNGIDSYLNFMHERLFLMKELLSEKGSIYVHVDWHISHYIKLIMDEIFGLENFRNEIIWYYPAASAQTKRFFVRSYDSILFYTKSDDYIFNDDPNIYMDYSKRVQNAVKKDENGYFYYRGGSHDGKKLSRKVYLEKKGVFPRDVWTKIPYIRANTLEYQGFSTQKPERLLKRIILASSNKNSIIADFFCGTGTTLAVSEKLNRRWMGCDLNWHAIKTTITRLLDLKNSNDILNWDEIYRESSSSFKVYSLIRNVHKGKIPEAFFNNRDTTLKRNKKPQLAVNLNRDKNKIKLSLDNYFFPYLELLNKKIKKKLEDWKELIDYFAVDFNYNNDEFIPQWISYRTPKTRKMRFNTGWYYYEKVKKKKIDIVVKIIDIFGFETTKKMTITL